MQSIKHTSFQRPIKSVSMNQLKYKASTNLTSTIDILIYVVL